MSDSTSNPSSINLADTGDDDTSLGDTGNPSTIKSTQTFTRIPFDELELTYLNNVIIFNGINKIVETIMSSHYEIVCSDEKVKDYFNNFVKGLGSSGSLITWHTLLTTIFFNQCKFGKAFIENIFNKHHTKIVDWDIIDPKSLDYAKDISDQVVTDNFGNPVGYFQSLPYASPTSSPSSANEDKLDDTTVYPDNVVSPTDCIDSIYLNPGQVAQTKLFPIGNNFYPVGLIEVVYSDSLHKLNLKSALANSLDWHGFPIIWAKLGDLNHEPNKPQIDSMLKKLKNCNHKKELATPYYYDISLLESTGSEGIREDIQLYQNQEVAGLGISQTLATGSAAGASNSALAKQTLMLMQTLNQIVTLTTTSIRLEMFKPICDLLGFKEVPFLKFHLVNSDELDRKAKRLNNYVKNGILSAEEVAPFIRKVENLPETK